MSIGGGRSPLGAGLGEGTCALLDPLIADLSHAKAFS